MKSKILTYALIFSILIIVFQYVNSRQIISKYEVDIQKCKDKCKKLENLGTPGMLEILEFEKICHKFCRLVKISHSFFFSSLASWTHKIVTSQ